MWLWVIDSLFTPLPVTTITITQPLCVSLERISQKPTPTHHRQEKKREKRWWREQLSLPHSVSFHRQHLLKQEASTATATATVQLSLRLASVKQTKEETACRRGLNLKIQIFNWAGTRTAFVGPEILFFLAAGRQPASETPTFFWSIAVRFVPLEDSDTSSRCSGNRQIKQRSAHLTAPADCADGGGALIICHLSVWLLGLGLSIIVVITFNWIHGIICNEPKFPYHRPSLDS